MTAIIILNIAFAALVVFGIVGLLGQSIVASKGADERIFPAPRRRSARAQALRLRQLRV